MNLLTAGWRAASLRFLAAKPGRSALTAAGIGLGITLLTTVLVLGATMQSALLNRMRAEFGTYDLLVSARDFETGAISPESLQQIREMPEVAFTVPLVTRYSASPDTPVQFYTGVGSFPPDQLGLQLLAGRLPGPGETALPGWLAERMGARLGERITLPFPDGTVTLPLVGLTSDGNAAALFDYDWLAARLGLPSPPALLVGLKPGIPKSRFAGLVQALDPSLRLDLRKSLDEARWKLDGVGTIGKVLGAAALLTGAFLTLAAFGITVQERARELAMLRALGASRGQVARLLGTEVLLLGAVGAAAGIALGTGIAWSVLGATGRYLNLPAEHLVISGTALLTVWAVGVALALAGAWPAIRQGSTTAPLAAMRPETEALASRQRRRGIAAGLLLLVLGAAAGTAGLHPALPMPVQMSLGLAGSLLLLLGVSVALAPLLRGLSRAAAAPLGLIWPALADIARRNLQRHMGRSTRTAGLIVLGTALLVALSGMIGTEVVGANWNWQRSNPTEGSITGPWGSPVGFGNDLVRQIAGMPGVADVIPLGRELQVELVGYDPERATASYRAYLDGGGDRPERPRIQSLAFDRLRQVWDPGLIEGDLRGGLILTRNQAAGLGLRLGEVLRVRPVGSGSEWSLPVAALVDRLPNDLVLAVDASAAPPLLLPDTEYRTAWVRLAPGADPAAVKAEIHRVLDDGYAAFSYIDREEQLASARKRLRESMALVGIAGLAVLLIALVGLWTTMMASLRSRIGEIAAMRAVGATPDQVGLMIGLESLLLGLAGSLLGVLTGVGMLLSTVGASLTLGAPLYLPAVPILGGLLAGPAVAVLAAVGPARGAVRLPLVSALKTE